MDTVRVGFVGAGFMGQLAHLWNYDQIDDCEVVALAEPQSELAAAVATRYDVPSVYEDYDAMLGDADLDAIVAAQPYQRYAHVVPDLLEAGVPLFTEKPAAVAPETAEELADMGEAAGVEHMIGYHKRSDPAMEHAKDVVTEWREHGDYGELRYVRITMPEGDWIAGAPDPITTDETPPDGEMEPLPERYDEAVAEQYNAFINYYIHQVNALRFFTEAPYEVTHADDGGTLLVGETADGVTGTIEMSPYRTSGDWQESILVGFDRGYVRVDLPAPLQRQTPGTVEVMRDEGDGEMTTTTPALPPTSAMRRQAENFLAVARGERAPPADVAEGAADLRVAADYIDRHHDA
jgi:predicted dehydrogenase